MQIDEHYDLIIIGAGPAGMSAALQASELGMKVLVLDDQAAAGGQVYRQVLQNHTHLTERSFLGQDYWSGHKLAEDFSQSSAEIWPESRVWQITQDKQVFFSQRGKAYHSQAEFILIATGAMERPMPIPGWTLPRVMSVGAAQTLLKTNNAGADGAVFAGSGPLFYLTVWQYLTAGFQIKAVIDTASARLSWQHYVWAVPALLQLGLLLKGLRWRFYIRKQTQYYSAVQAVSMSGSDAVENICFTGKDGKRHRIAAHHVFIHQGVVPNINLTMTTGLEHRWCRRQLCWHPQTDIYGESTLPGIFVAGDGMGIAGAGAAVLSGKTVAKRMARYTRRPSFFSGLLTRLHRWQQSAARPFLDHLFSPPQDWLVPVDDKTIICRCEGLSKADVSAAIRLGVAGPNQLKSFCRAGMGRCQGRMCGLTVQKMIAEYNKQSEKDVGYYRLRPPVRPLTVGELASLADDDVAAE